MIEKPPMRYVYQPPPEEYYVPQPPEHFMVEYPPQKICSCCNAVLVGTERICPSCGSEV
jgi:hypothetical protein